MVKVEHTKRMGFSVPMRIAENPKYKDLKKPMVTRMRDFENIIPKLIS